MSDPTTLVLCPCCGEHVALTLTGGFAGTTAELAACAATRRLGVRSHTIGRSAALGLTPAAAGPVAHRKGLVAFAGAR